MRRTALLLLLFVFAAQFLQAQKIDSSNKVSSQELYNHFIKKKKTNSTIGSIMLVSGLLMTTAGLVIGSSEDRDVYAYPSATSFGFVLAGVSTTVLSIPFFVFAGKNKKRAQMTLKEEFVMTGNKIHFKSNYPAISFVIQL